MPLAMTALNCASSAVYTRGFDLKDKIQVYGIAFVFFALLYNSPSGLVIYWTCNNAFSFIKNLLSKIKYKKIIVYSVLFTGVFIIDLFLLFKHSGDLPNRILAAASVSIAACLVFLPYLYRRVATKIEKLKNNSHVFAVYFLSCITLFLLLGVAVPASLIESSVLEFSFLGQTKTPLEFIFNTAKQSAGIFLFWPAAVYFLFTPFVRRVLMLFMLFAAVFSIVNVFLIKESFGFITTTLIFSETKNFSLIPSVYLINLLELCAAAALLFFVIKSRKCSRLLIPVQLITAVSLLAVSIFFCAQIQNEFNALKQTQKTQTANSENFESEFIFSTHGKNVLLIMLDCVVGFYMPYIFEEKPELRDSFSGFTHYLNCVSYANHTLVGALPIYGGYEYTPSAVNGRAGTPLLEKQKEAYLLLPELFTRAGYSAVVSDPSFDNFQMSNLAPFYAAPKVKAKNINGKYTAAYLKKHPNITAFEIDTHLKNNLIKFSFFKSAPLFLRLFIYNGGDWWQVKKQSKQLTASLLDDYALLDMLPQITSISEQGNTYTALYSHLPHGTALFQTPSYEPSSNITVANNNSPFSSDGRYHTIMASFLLLEKWFNFFKEKGVYDNTRIILVSDHGRGSSNVKENIRLPAGELQYYNPLLMVKDFMAEGGIKTDNSFMTNADAALLALKDFENPVNPWTQNQLKPDKDKGVFVTTIGALSTYRHNKYTYNIKDTEWLFVRDNIFDAKNWTRNPK